MTGHAVVIAGGGPAGLMLAGELALAGADVAVVERRATQELEGSRSRGLHTRTIEVLDQRGIAERFTERGQAVPFLGFAGTRLGLADLPTRHPYLLALPQARFEPILAAWVAELKVPVYRGQEVTGFRQDETGVDVELSGRPPLRARYLVGCDGGRSLVRKTAGIGFPGFDPSVSSLIAEVEMTGQPPFGIRRDKNGTQAIGPLGDDRTGVAVVVTEAYRGQADEPTMDDLRRALTAVWGTDFGAHSPVWLSRFTDAARQAASYRAGRVLLAGDAAHVHYPVGGQGLNTGVQDAVNLGWKLGLVVRGTAPDQLLDSYQAERHPVAAQVLRGTLAQTALNRGDPRTDALRDTVADLLGLDEPRHRMAAMLSGLDIHYDLGPGHPLLGRRMPDLDLVTADGPTRVFTLLHQARPLLLDFDGPGRLGLGPWADRVWLARADTDGPWDLPTLGPVAAPAAVLVRPDGHVAWVGDGTDKGLTAALATWFGPPTSPATA